MEKKTEYKSLGSLTKTIRSLEAFDFERAEIEEIEENLLQKRPKSVSLEEISEFYELMQERHGEIPGEIHEYIENLLIKEVRNKFVGASELVDMVN